MYTGRRHARKRWAGWPWLARASYFPVLAAWTVGYFGKLFWVFDLAAHFKAQYLLASLVFVPIFAYLRQRHWFHLALLCALANSLHVVPLYLPARSYLSAKDAVSSRPPGRQVRMLHSNLHIKNRNHAALLKLICSENPDLIVVQEVTSEWAAALESIRDRYPEGIVVPEETAGGIGVLSRLPLLVVQQAQIEKYNGPTLEVHVRVDDQIVYLLTSHTRPPISRAWFSDRNVHFNALADHLQSMPAPKVLVGDLNSTVWSPYFAESIKRTGMVDARQGVGLLPTWPTWLPLMEIPIDQLFVSPDVEVVNLKVGADIGSDHRPLIIDLRLH